MSGRAEKTAGSPAAGEPAILVVGKVRRPHGLNGDVLVEIQTDFPDRLQPGVTVYSGEKHLPLKICRQRHHNDGILLAFEGYTTPEQVGRFRNTILSVNKTDASELPQGEYYFYELLDIEVVDEIGSQLGKLTEIIETGANDVYVVTNESKRELLIPAIPEVILNIDLDKKQMTVHLLPGLLENGDQKT